MQCFTYAALKATWEHWNHNQLTKILCRGGARNTSNHFRINPWRTLWVPLACPGTPEGMHNCKSRVVEDQEVLKWRSNATDLNITEISMNSWDQSWALCRELLLTKSQSSLRIIFSPRLRINLHPSFLASVERQAWGIGHWQLLKTKFFNVPTRYQWPMYVVQGKKLSRWV